MCDNVGMPALSVLVLDSHDVVRLGLASMVEATDVVDRCESAAAPVEHRADVVIGAPDLVGAAPAGARRLVVIAAGDSIDDALASGADGYLMLVDLTVSDLREALVAVMHGDVPLPAAVSDHMLAAARAGDRPRTPLRPREDDVLELLVTGHSNQEIAAHLGISIHSAKRHVSSILAKFDSPSRSHLVSRVLQARAT